MFTLTYKGQARPMREWGLGWPRKYIQNQGEDEVTFSQALAKTGDAAVFADDEEVLIQLDGKPWFRGRVFRSQRRVTARSKRIEYVVLGPWNLFNRLVYQQLWDDEPAPQYTSHVFLNVEPRLTVKQVIEDVIDFAIARGVPITKGNILISDNEFVQPPANEIDNQTCASVVLLQSWWLLRQAVIWFDYSTVNPTMHVRRGDNLPVVTLGIPADNALKKIAEVDVSKMGELKRPEVVIKYEITHTIDGDSVPRLVVDQYPPGATGLSIDALMLTFNMQGISVTHIEQPVVVEDINAAHANEATRLAWWREHCDTLGDELRVKNLTIEPGSVRRGTNPPLPRALVHGALADWMGVDFQEEVITALATYEVWHEGATKPVRITQPIQVSAKVMATDAVTKTYRAPQSVQEGDPIPVGLAQFLYELSQGEQWGGTVRLKERELTTAGMPVLGTRLNIINGAAEWAAMNAVVQAVEEVPQFGERIVTLRPLTIMTAAQMMQLLWKMRSRRRWTNPLAQTDRTKSRSQAVALPPGLPRRSSNADHGGDQAVTVKGEAGEIVQDGVGGLLLLDFGEGKTMEVSKLDPVWGQAASKALSIRKVCAKQDGRTGHMLVIGSALF